MKRTDIYILPVVLVTAISCTGSSLRYGKDMPIFIDPESGDFSTKSLFEPDNFHTPGNTLRVYDKFTLGDASTMHINGDEATCDGTNWNFGSPKYWTKTGTHSFTAYAAKNISDGTLIAPDGSGTPATVYDEADESLTVGPWTITSESQFDFIYGHHTRKMTETNPYRPVPLQMKHLLCALQFNFVNLIPDDDVVFKSFLLEGIYRQGTAVIAKESLPAITLENNTGTAFEKSADRSILYNETYNIFADTGKAGADGYMLAWPHPNDRFSDIKGVLTYTQKGISATKEIDFTVAETNNWRAGYRYVYNLYLHDNKITFEVKVLPWIVDDVIIDG